MKCPTCSVDLNISHRHNVEIDYCPQCRGVWLDRGELDKIVERASRYDELERHGDDDADGDRYEGRDRPPHHVRPHPERYARRKSFWAELFD